MPNIPKKHHAVIIDACFNAIANPNEPGAVRAFAMLTINKLTPQYPELNNELSVLLEPLVHHQLPSVSRTAYKILRQISG